VKPVVHNDSSETIRDVFVKLYDGRGQHLGDTGLPSQLGPRYEATCFSRVEVPAARDLGDRMVSAAEVFLTDAGGRQWKKAPDRMPARVFGGG
jgi:hypothetical protein